MKIIVVLLGSAALCSLVWWAFAGGGEASPPAALEPAAPEDDVAHVAGPIEMSAPSNGTASEDSRPSEVPLGEPRSTRQSAEGPADVVGRVLDRHSGAPLEGFLVTLLAAGRSVESSWTDAAGTFSFSRRRFGRKEFAVRVYAPEGWVVVDPSQRIDAERADEDVQIEFRAKRWPPEVAGDISGWLRAESGGFAPGSLPRDRHLVLDLVSTDQPPISRRGEIHAVRNAKGEVDFRFRFRDVPAGEYNLTLSSLGNYRWVPTSLLVTPPAAGIEFLCFDLDEVLELVFEVFDVQTRERIFAFDTRHIKQTSSEGHGVFLHTGPLEDEQFPLNVPFVWSLEAPGYAIAYGNESSFTVEDGKRVARVYLERGWSTRFLVMGGEPYPRPLVGAEIYLDGELAGKTGVDGALNVKAAEHPLKVDVRYADWVPAQPIDLWGVSGARRRSNVTPILMEERADP